MNSTICAKQMLQGVLFSSDDVENRGRNCGQRFPHCDPQWKRERGWDEKHKTSHQLMSKISLMQVFMVDLKEPGQEVDLGGQNVALLSP